MELLIIITTFIVIWLIALPGTVSVVGKLLSALYHSILLRVLLGLIVAVLVFIWIKSLIGTLGIIVVMIILSGIHDSLFGSNNSR